MPEERRVDEIRGGDLERRRVETGHEVGARLVEDRGEERDALFAAELPELEPVAGRQLERLAVLPVGRAEAVLVVVRRVVLLAGEERAVVALLELHGVDAALLRRADQRLCLIEIALVVVPDLCDDIRRAVARDRLAVDDQLPHGPDGTQDSGPEPPSASR